MNKIQILILPVSKLVGQHTTQRGGREKGRGRDRERVGGGAERIERGGGYREAQ